MGDEHSIIDVSNKLRRSEYLPSIDEYVRRLLDKLPAEQLLIDTYKEYEREYINKFFEEATNLIYNNIVMRKFRDGTKYLNLVCCTNLTDDIITELLKQYNMLIEPPYDSMEPLEIYDKYFKGYIEQTLIASHYYVTHSISSVNIGKNKIRVLNIVVKWELETPKNISENDEIEE